MYKICLGFLGIFLLAGCMTPAPVREEPPRRQYESVATDGKTVTDLFVVNQYAKSSLAPSENSRRFSTALFLSDLSILDDISDADFEKISAVIFGDFPDGDQEKEVVIPSLSKFTPTAIEKAPVERDAYLFIKKAAPQGEIQSYRVETNIPIASVYAKDYDGYIINSKANFYKNVVPARWTAILNIAYNGSTVVYEGVAYPRRAAPLIFTGTGIGPDGLLKKVVATGARIEDTMSELDSTVTKATAEQPTDPAEQASVLFLKKYSEMSLALYAYLSEKNDVAAQHFEKASAVDVQVPEDGRGSRYRELQKVMKFLLGI